MSYGDELHAFVDESAEGLDGHLPAFVVRHRHDFRAGAFRDLDVGDVVADVVGYRRQDAVAALERERVEGHVPCARGAGAEGDFVRMCAEQVRSRAVEPLHGLFVLCVRLVAADAAFELHVADDRGEHLLRRQ